MNNATTLIIEDLSHLKGKSADHVTRFLKDAVVERKAQWLTDLSTLLVCSMQIMRAV